MNSNDPNAALLARRRQLLWSVPFGLMTVQGCGGGGSAVAATAATPAPAPAPAPSPAPSPAPVSSAAPAPASVAIASVTAWASRPAAAASSGQAIIVSDVGVSGSLWVSDGNVWLPTSNPMTLAHKFSNATMDASVGASADVLLDSFKIPAYVLGPSSGLRITAAYSFPGGGTASKAPQIRAYFGVGTYAISATPLLDSRGQFATQKTFLLNVTLQNCNSMAVNQIRPIDYGIGASGNAFSTAAIDFTQDVTVGFGGLNNSTSVSTSDQQVLEWFSIEML